MLLGNEFQKVVDLYEYELPLKTPAWEANLDAALLV